MFSHVEQPKSLRVWWGLIEIMNWTYLKPMILHYTCFLTKDLYQVLLAANVGKQNLMESPSRCFLGFSFRILSPLKTQYVWKMLVIYFNKTWSSVSNSSLSKIFALGSLQNLKFRTSVSSLQRSFSLKFILGQKKIFGFIFFRPKTTFGGRKQSFWTLSFLNWQRAKVLLKLEFDTEDQVL